MMIRVPARGFNGLGFVGLGQVDVSGDNGSGEDNYSGEGDTSTFQPTTGPSTAGLFYDTETGSYVNPSALTSTSSVNSDLTALDASLNNTAAQLPVPQSLSPAQTGALQTVAASPTPTPSATQLGQIVTNGTSTGLTANQISAMVAAAANAGVQILRATNMSTPTLIPGTNLVYNPATGQIVPSGTTLSTALGSATLSSSGLLIGGLLIGGVLLIMMMKR